MISLQQFLQNSDCEEKLAELMGAVLPIAVKQVRAAIESDQRDFAGSQNASGDNQLALDILSNQIVMEELEESGLVAKMASEEIPNIVTTNNPEAPFDVVFDPLDGSSLVDVNFAVGSIFGVYPNGDILGRSGDKQVAAAFAVYGPYTTLMITIRDGTHEFRLNPDDGVFYLMKEDCSIAADAKFFAVGNLRAASERDDYLEVTNSWIKKSMTLRYSGGMVPDINLILIKGSGIFTYPSYSKTPSGKLRLLFECNPIALLIEQAGGVAVDNEGTRILDKVVREVHEPSPIFLGSKNTVRECVKTMTAVS